MLQLIKALMFFIKIKLLYVVVRIEGFQGDSFYLQSRLNSQVWMACDKDNVWGYMDRVSIYKDVMYDFLRKSNVSISANEMEDHWIWISAISRFASGAVIA